MSFGKSAPVPYLTATDPVDLDRTDTDAGFKLIFALQENTVCSIKYALHASRCGVCVCVASTCRAFAATNASVHDTRVGGATTRSSDSDNRTHS